MKVCLAGHLKKRFISQFMQATPYCLQSMYYIGEWELEYIKQFDFFILDSGACIN